MEKIIALIGMFILFGLAYLLCSKEHRKFIDYKLVIMGTILQFIFAVLILKTSPGKMIFDKANTIVNKLLGYTIEGSKFIFGDLVAKPDSFGFIFAFQVLPTIVFFSSLMSVLYYLGIMQKVVNIIAKVMAKIMGTSGAESLCAAANIFVGQTEAPLMIKPFIEKMTRSEIMAVMCGGMATIAGGVMASYVGMFGTTFPEMAGHLMAASVMSAPASLVFAKMVLPETEESETKGSVKITEEKKASNIIEAAASGASEGMSLALNVAAMLLAFIALIALFNGLLGYIGSLFGFENLSMELLMGYVFAPFAYIMGTPSNEVLLVGRLIGEKTILNEFVAYVDMAKNIDQLSDTSKIIATYALCGFSNLSSIAIQIGGIGGLAPSRKGLFASLGIKALIAASFACFQTAIIAVLVI